MVQWAQGTRWHSSMTGEGTISFYSLEIKQTGDGGSAQGLTSYWGQYDDQANQAALGCGDPAPAFHEPTMQSNWEYSDWSSFICT